jgi:hypothetical protein
MGYKSMTDINILNAKDFTFAPFNPDVGGDRGALLLATLKRNSQIQYVIKSGYPEIACNEFMYHHIAAALGLYTQKTRLFTGIDESKYVVGIRYVPNARKFIYEEADEDNRRIYNEFRMLFVILNEEDSEEFFYDEQNRVFKLDNAASFNLDTSKVESALKYGNNEPPNWVWQKLINGLDFIEYSKYNIILNILNKYYGRTAVETGFEFIKRFSEFDLSKIESAIETLEKIYPLTITEYYPAFIERRINTCKRFITENKISQYINE